MRRLHQWMDKDAREFRDAMRSVFSTEDGRWVFKGLLHMTGVFKAAHTEEERLLRNFGQELLDIMEITHEANIDAIVNAYLKTPTVSRPKENDEGDI